ncbi:MAG: hypothetical protein HDR34_03530 [Treponema sp.]|nr:hypothetical protein [Treponema sp.]
MENEGNKTIVHHIVYSIKGGCGKTAFSLCLTVSELNALLNKIFDGEYNNYEAVNYFLDLDFLGTSLMHCLSNADKTQLVTMQDLMFRNKKVEDMKKNCEKILGNKFFIIPAEVHEIEKSIFHVKRKHTPLLKYDEFRYEIENLQKTIELTECCCNEKGEKTKVLINLIYDLPPNSDGYTEAFFEEVFNLDKESNKVIIYIIFNNAPMLMCNLDWLNTFLCGSDFKDCSIVLVNNSEFLNVGHSKNGNISNEVSVEVQRKYCPNCRYKDTWLYSFSNKDKIRELYDVIDEKRKVTKILLSDTDTGIKFSDSEFNSLVSLDDVEISKRDALK